MAIYDEVIQDQLQTGVIERVMTLKSTERVHYLAHHAVIREEAETTKVGIVFYASCKENRNSTSLNDCLHVGPSLTPLVFDILLRFRHYKVPLIGDIEKAYLNIEINASDRGCLRFLWVNSIESDSQDIEIYRYRKVAFGVNSFSFLLNAVLRYHFEAFKDEDTAFVEKLLEEFFVDDFVSGVETVRDAFSLYIKAKDRLRVGGFTLRKLKSCQPELLQMIQNNESPAKDVPTVIGDETEHQINSTSKSEKVLGIPWDMQRDTIQVSLSHFEVDDSVAPTKRILLQNLAAIFDPIGLVSPVVVPAKVLLQELWVEKIDWDEPLPADKISRLKKWGQDLKKCK